MLDQLDSVPLSRMYQASFKAVVRVHLFFTGRTHELFHEFTRTAQVIVMQKAEGGMLDGSAGFQAQSEILKVWGDTFKTWSDEFERVRREAASIPFGVLAVAHERLVMPVVSEQLAEGRRQMQEAVEDGVFSPQLEILLNAAGNHLYGDSLNLSQRIWRIDREARDGITAVILNGIQTGDSAWNIAKQLEQYLGANQDCPRWTSTRLYGRTKTQIAQGDTTGLVANPCDGRGVAYNALRLARTEIQKAHALATDRVLAAQPWVEKEQVHLSAAHPEEDICDEVTGGGEQGKGVYAVGEIELPLHPNCLCYKTAVLMPEDEFASKMNAWIEGREAWGEMDDYAGMLGDRGVGESILPNAINLAVWLFGRDLEGWIS